MKRAIIQLELTGENVSLEDAEELGKALRFASSMIPLPAGTTLKVGQITLMNGEENGNT